MKKQQTLTELKDRIIATAELLDRLCREMDVRCTTRTDHREWRNVFTAVVELQKTGMLAECLSKWVRHHETVVSALAKLSPEERTELFQHVDNTGAMSVGVNSK